MAQSVMRNQSTVVVVLVAGVMLAALLRGVNGWNITDFANDVCQDLAASRGVACLCVDVHIVPFFGTNLCGYPKPLGNGLNVGDAIFDAWSDITDLPAPTNGILFQEICDARNSHGATLNCIETESQTVTYTTATTLSSSLGIEAHIGSVALPIGGGITLTVSGSQQTLTSNALMSGATCGPGGLGQPNGTCSVYTQQYHGYALQGGFGFTYTANISGGVQMSFSPAFDAAGALGLASDGSELDYWWISIGTLVTYAQSYGISNADMFNPAAPEDRIVTFHGAGVVSNQVMAKSSCTVADCTSSSEVM